MKLRTEPLFIRLQILSLAGIMAIQALGNPAIASLLFTITFLLTLGLWLTTAAKRISSSNLLAISILAVSCISVCANALMTGTVVSFGYFKKVIMFWSTILLFGAMGEHQPRWEDVRFLFRWNTVLACFLIGMYLLRRDQMHLLNGMVTLYLTFRFTNPNLAAVFLSSVCMIELIQAAAMQRKMEKCFHMALAGCFLFFVFETRARNAQLALVFFWLMFLSVGLFPRWRPEMRGWMTALITLFPLAFAMGYLLLVNTPAVQDMFSFLIGEGKDLDSRVDIWRFALQSFASSPLTGAYSQISGGTGASQLHNSHLDILASYGAPVFGLVMLLVFRTLYGKRRLRGGRIHFLCQIGFAAILLSGTGEAMLFSGGMGIYLFTGVLLMLANFDFDNGDAVP